MRRHVSSATLTLVLVVTGALALGVFVPRAVAITFGEVDAGNTHCDVGCLVYQAPDAPDPIVVSTGMLVHPRVFLTAGHVTIQTEQDPALMSRAYVSFAANAFDQSDHSTWGEVEASITHPNYGPVHNQVCSDVGAIILKKPLRGVPLAKLPYAGYLDDLNAAQLLRSPGEGGLPFRVVGYGSTLGWSPPVSTPGDGWRRFADSAYLNVLPEWLLTQQNLAAGHGGTGYGDSGGPAYWTEPDGTLVLVGLTCWGDPNLVAMNFYSRVDLPETLDFINAVIGALP
jgi:Trypsin